MIHKFLGKKKEPVFGKRLDPNSSDIPTIITKCISLLDSKGYDTEGIFRIPGRTMMINEYKEKFDKEEDTSLEPLADDIHTVAGILKLYFRELPEPLCPYEFYDMFLGAVTISDEQTRCKQIKKVLKFLPKIYYKVIAYLVGYLWRLSSHQDKNKMTPNNLAIVFAPSLLKPQNQSLQTQVEDSPYAVSFLKTLIEHHDYFFNKDDPELRQQQGSLTIKVLRARELAAKDSNGLSDPYCAFNFGKSTAKTKIIFKNLNPVWNEHFTFDITPETLEIVLDMWDYDRFTPDDFLGRVVIPLYSLKNKHTPAQWYQLQQRTTKDIISGSVELEISYEGTIFFPDKSGLPIDFELILSEFKTVKKENSQPNQAYQQASANLQEGHEIYRRCIGFLHIPLIAKQVFETENVSLAQPIDFKKTVSRPVPGEEPKINYFMRLTDTMYPPIFSFLSTVDFLRAGRVCKQWHNLTAQSSVVKYSEKLPALISKAYGTDDKKYKLTTWEAVKPVVELIATVVEFVGHLKQDIKSLLQEIFPPLNGSTLTILSEKHRPACLLMFLRLLTLCVALESWKKSCVHLKSIFSFYSENYKEFAGEQTEELAIKIHEQNLFCWEQKYYILEAIEKPYKTVPVDKVDRVLAYLVEVIQKRKYLTENGMPLYLEGVADLLILFLFCNVTKSIKGWVEFVKNRRMYLPHFIVQTLDDLSK